MRKVQVDGRFIIEKNSREKLIANSPTTGGWFPASRALDWIVNKNSLFPPHLVFSVRLETVSVTMSKHPGGYCSTLASIISAIPASTLRSLNVRSDFKSLSISRELSSIISNCESPFTKFVSFVPLENKAVEHLIQLPHLDTLVTVNPPPFNLGPPPLDHDLPFGPGVPLSLVFPPLTELIVGTGVVQGWLALFKLLEARVSAANGAMPVSRVKKSLGTLVGEDPRCPIDASFTSPIRMFRNLVHLDIRARCNGGFGCAFRLNDNNIAELAMALHQVEYFSLGEPCAQNTCATTVACLLFFSVYCTRLRILTIHFNTTNIVDDFNHALEGSQFRELRLCPRCPLSCLDVHSIPLHLDGPDFETVVNGMVDIFPSLKGCGGGKGIWKELSAKILQFRGV
jgi:hypothetical protein